MLFGIGYVIFCKALAGMALAQVSDNLAPRAGLAVFQRSFVL
jgi:hypothetical protein